jgi:hypothetical protein
MKKLVDCLVGLLPRKGRTMPLLLAIALLAPGKASAAALLEAFTPINGKCHWTQINSETGRVLSAWPVDSPKCPTHANRTTAADGSQLFAVKFRSKSPSRTALWQLRKGAKALDVLPRIHNLTLGWKAGGALRAVTENFRADVDPNALQADAPPKTEEDFKEIADNQWKRNCYRYILKNGAWKPEGGETVETHEGMRGPACLGFMKDWSSSAADYSDHLFFVDNSKDGPPSGLGEHGFGISTNLDITHSGKPCLKACKNSEILRRYAFSIEWYEGHMLSGQVATFKAGKWQLVQGVFGTLREFFRADDQLIFCTEKGFGGWDHNNAKRLWWRASPTCPFKEPVTVSQLLGAFDGIDLNQKNSGLPPFGLPRKFVGDKTCTARLWVNKPEGVPVLRRASPKTEKPIGTLAGTTYFKIVSGRRGLVRFKNPTDVDGMPTTGPQSGLIPSKHVFVSVALRSHTDIHDEPYFDGQRPELVLFESPWVDAKPVIKWTAPHPSVTKAQQIIDVFGCVGGWIKIKYHDGRANYVGWLHPKNQCSNQRTTCP